MPPPRTGSGKQKALNKHLLDEWMNQITNHWCEQRLFTWLVLVADREQKPVPPTYPVCKGAHTRALLFCQDAILRVHILSINVPTLSPIWGFNRPRSPHHTLASIAWLWCSGASAWRQWCRQALPIAMGTAADDGAEAERQSVDAVFQASYG
jgi:hypothetical protein